MIKLFGKLRRELKRLPVIAYSAAACKSISAKVRCFSIIRSAELNDWSELDSVLAEVKARDMLRRAEEAIPWMPTPIYPAGGAAGPLFLYLLARLLAETSKIQKVLELGAGQSTLILDSWANAQSKSVHSFEHDEIWVQRMLTLVNPIITQVHYLPLETLNAEAATTSWYALKSLSGLDPLGGFDLLLVDGPPGCGGFSRCGIIDHIPEWLNKEFVILWDDLHRPADLESFAFLVQKLRRLGVPHDHLIWRDSKAIGIIYTPGYACVRSFF